jgi:SAM-dependent methyltransferase|tara:strand:+ start:607 stop:1395 length:789 start_codon:yes stop_codon:yes gene_type:complete
MRHDANELDRFYQSQRGKTACDMIWRRIRVLWPDMRDLDVLGLGFASPILNCFDDTPRRSVALMPAAQGAVIWPGEGASRTTISDETRLPFPDAMFDRVVLLHALEEAESIPALLREVWRVMAPQGRMVLIVSNRSGAWARADGTPFGHGRPFSKGQITRVLGDAAFEATAWSRALYAPPMSWCCGPGRSEFWESVGEKLYRGLSGVVLVEAVKRVAALTPRAARSSSLRIRGLEGARPSAISPSTSKTTSAPSSLPRTETP